MLPGRRAGVSEGVFPGRSGLGGGVTAGDGVTVTCVPLRGCDSIPEFWSDTAGNALDNAGGSEGVEWLDETIFPGPLPGPLELPGLLEEGAAE